jgi:hypothetical protein
MKVHDHALKRYKERFGRLHEKQIRILATKAWQKGFIFQPKRLTIRKFRLYRDKLWVYDTRPIVQLVTVLQYKSKGDFLNENCDNKSITPAE